MRDNGFIDLTGEDRLWRWHRVSAVALLVLVIAHLSLRLPTPVGFTSSACRPIHDIAEDALLVALALVATFHVLIGIRLFRRLCPMLWPRSGQRHLMTWCIAAERFSGFALGGFLALHLCLVAIATTATPDLDSLIRQAGGSLVTMTEGIVLMMLVLHGVGGIRVLIQEVFSTHRMDRPLALLTVIAAAAAPIAWWFAIG